MGWGTNSDWCSSEVVSGWNMPIGSYRSSFWSLEHWSFVSMWKCCRWRVDYLLVQVRQCCALVCSCCNQCTRVHVYTWYTVFYMIYCILYVEICRDSIYFLYIDLWPSDRMSSKYFLDDPNLCSKQNPAWSHEAQAFSCHVYHGITSRRYPLVNKHRPWESPICNGN